MQFSKLSIAAAIFGSTSAALNLTDVDYAGITANKPFDITWSGASGPVTLILVNDVNPDDVTPIETIASGQSGTSFAWTPAASLPSGGVFALQIQDAVTTNYAGPFDIASATGSLTSSASSAASSSGSASSTTTDMTTSSTTTGTSTSTSGSSTGTSTSTGTSKTTSSKTSTSSTASSKTSSSAPAGTTTGAPSSANGLASPLAFVFLAVAAIVCIN